jgi:transposase
MHEFTGAHPDWLTVIQLPAYAPEPNPVEGLWASTKNGLGNLAACTADQLAAVIRTRLKASSTGPHSSTDSSARLDSALNPNHREDKTPAFQAL